eukprot:CAMPEP_0172494546 /NCGR_PEP_ID=MMETSP1066-20121228/51203_1 /TAXON_ID=671091 /ORGANISM="Coscinodiscus wailesii, Strain CCMP2513" /LENGTH=198 /DNA_ID=CAMNT_0013265609 /DNA_START=236 /DNA_END=833 /DNA_ORIENTATION=+
MFIQVNTLPCTQCEIPIPDRNVDTDPHERTLNVTGHVIVPLHRVMKRPVAVPARRDNFIESHFHVSPDIGVSILIDCQASRSMLYEQIRHANFNLRYVLADGLVDVVRDEVTPAEGAVIEISFWNQRGTLDVIAAAVASDADDPDDDDRHLVEDDSDDEARGLEVRDDDVQMTSAIGRKRLKVGEMRIDWMKWNYRTI